MLALLSNILSSVSIRAVPVLDLGVFSEITPFLHTALSSPLGSFLHRRRERQLHAPCSLGGDQ